LMKPRIKLRIDSAPMSQSKQKNYSARFHRRLNHTSETDHPQSISVLLKLFTCVAVRAWRVVAHKNSCSTLAPCNGFYIERKYLIIIFRL